MGFHTLETGLSRAGGLADSNQILHSPLLANIRNPGCIHGGAADFQGSFVASQHSPQKGAARTVVPIKLSLPANRNLVHTERKIILGKRS